MFIFRSRSLPGRTVRFCAFFLLTLLFAVYPSYSQIPAFPGAEGFGSLTPGGRGGIVYAVTSLSDENSPGTLRHGISLAGPRTIVFRVGGDIHLVDHIPIENPFITIAGQTAPGDGITLRGAGLRVKTHDVVIRGIRIRVGDEGGAAPDSRDAIEISAPATNVIVDHCSFSWAIDENGSTFEPVSEVTFQWCIFSEGLMNSIHSQGPHSMGMLLAKDQASMFSIHHNLFLHNNARNPQVADLGSAEIINNLIYDWGTEALALERGARANVIGNVFIHGDNTENPVKPPVSMDPLDLTTRAYVRANIGPTKFVSDTDEWLIVDGNPAQRSMVPVIPLSGVTENAAESLIDLLAANAGAHAPDRDPVDDRVVYSILHGLGRIIDSQNEVGGWPVLDPGIAPPDADGDGMPDIWENENGFNYTDAGDAQLDADGDGYTNLEEFINGLFKEQTTIPNAGPDRALCRITSTTLDGNTPLMGRSRWRIISGDGSIVNPNSPDATVINLGPGAHGFEYEVLADTGPLLRDTVMITVYPYPTDADAGPDQSLCNMTESVLTGNEPLAGSGVWRVLSGGATLVDSLNPASPVSNLSPGLHEFVWVITGDGGCSSRDTVALVVDLPPTQAVAEADRLICNSMTTRIVAARALVGTGLWRVLTGSAIIDDPTANNPIVTGLEEGANSFEWTISSGGCPPSTDTLVVTMELTPVPDFTWTVAGLTVSFSSFAQHAESYWWTFGDGATDTTANPVHTYAEIGSYRVKLTVSNDCASRTRPKRVNLEGLSGLMKITTDTLSFRPVGVGTIATAGIGISNSGSDTLEVSPFGLVGPGTEEFQIADGEWSIPPGGESEIPVSFRPLAAGEYTGQFRIFGQDSACTVTLVGRGTDPSAGLADGQAGSPDDPMEAETRSTIGAHSEVRIPESIALFQNYPNPFNPETEIRYGLVQSSLVRIKVFDLLGSEVATLVDRVEEAGYHSVRWTGKGSDGGRVSGGIYFYRLTTGSTTFIRKMMFLP